MNELLTIESAFLQLSAVKDALNLRDIKRVQRSITNAHKSKFGHTMKMAVLVKNAVEFYESEEGIELFAEEGIQWSKEELGNKVFGWQKSFFYKVIKAGKIDQRIIDAFNIKCDAIGDDSARSLALLLTFAKTINLNELGLPADASEEEVLEAEAEAIESAEVETPTAVPTILTLSFKNPNGNNVAVRITADGDYITTNNSAEIRLAISVLATAGNLTIMN
tara:strand:+ start:4268 stop:4930 length:663 start_codon:yes stop_codon:yes gene_type:complete